MGILQYYIDYYLNFDAGLVLNELLIAATFACLFVSFGKDLRSLMFFALRFLACYAIVSLNSALFYWLFPGSDFGSQLTHVVSGAVIALISRRAAVVDRIVGTSITVTVIAYSSAISLPLVFLDVGEFLVKTRLLSFLLKAAMYAGVVILLRKCRVGNYLEVSFPFLVLIEGLCIVGYVLNTVALMLVYPNRGDAFSYNFYNCLGLTLIEILAYIMFYLSTKEYNEKRALIIYDERIENELQMLKNYEIGYNQVREVRHEILNQYSYINVLLKEKQYDKATEYFDELRVFVGSAGKIIFTENGIVNIALNLAKEKAERSGINTDIRAAVPRELKISDVELTSLLTNLSDNAIEGCLRVAPEKRMLEIVATYTNGYLTVRTVNSVDPDTVHMGKDGFVTAKEDKEKHGIGTRIIKKIAEGHSGCVRYEVKDGKFVADVMLKCDRA